MNLGFRTHISNLYNMLLKFQYYKNEKEPEYLGENVCEKPENKSLTYQKFFKCTMLEDSFREIGNIF